MSDLSLTVKKTVPASAEDVFNAWLDPEMLMKFMIPMDGAYVPKAEVDAREGGEFHIMFMAGDEEIPHSGTYKEINRHSKLVFTWQSPFSADGSEVTLTFKPDGADATEVELHHVKFVTEESRDNHHSGWTLILEKLAEAV